MGSMHLSTDTRQTPTLSPRLQRAVQLLQMSSLDFAAMVRGKIDENPFLEEETDDAPDGERDLWIADRPPGHRPSEETGTSAMELATCDTTLAMHLHGQLNLMPLTGRDRCIACAVVESLDEDGYLRTPLEELIAQEQLSPPPQPDELRVALRLVQSLDPVGVAARSVGECLLLQCPRIEDPAIREIAQAIVQHHLEALAGRDLPQLGKALRQPAARIAPKASAARRHAASQSGTAVDAAEAEAEAEAEEGAPAPAEFEGDPCDEGEAAAALLPLPPLTLSGLEGA